MKNIDKNFPKYLQSIDAEFNNFKILINKKNIILPKKISNKKFKELYYNYRSLTGSRVFSIYTNSGKENVLVPIVDLINHSNTPNVKWTFNISSNLFEVTTTKYIKKGKQIFDSYGKKLSNTHLLLYYGFTYKNNKNDYIQIKINNNTINLRHNSNNFDFMNNINISRYQIINILRQILDKNIKIFKKNKKKSVNKNINNIINGDLSILTNNLKYCKKI